MRNRPMTKWNKKLPEDCYCPTCGGPSRLSRQDDDCGLYICEGGQQCGEFIVNTPPPTRKEK